MGTNLKKLAQELNLSIATVSRALQDSHEVSSATKAKVWALAQKLSYEPNPYASSLRRQKSKTIAVVIPEIANNFFTLAIKGVDEIAQKKGYHVLIYFTHDKLEKEISIIKHLQNGRVDGILMSISSETDCYDHLIELNNKKIPIVFFDRVYEEIEGVPTVTTDDYESAYKATEHLIQSGCKKISYLQVSKNLSIGKKRMNGYLNALKSYGMDFNEELVVYGSHNDNENYNKIKGILNKENHPDGIFASVENLAISTYYACIDLALSIPAQVKIISFSNLATAPLLSTSLTTITQPAFEIGKEAAYILFQRLKRNNMKLNNYQFKNNIVLHSTLNIRDSTKASI